MIFHATCDGFGGWVGPSVIDLMARVDFLQISLMWLLDDKLLSIITPRFLAFFVMLISVPANVMLSPKDDCLIKRYVKCNTLVFPGLLLSMFLV